MLFEPFEFAGLSMKNRIVRSATYEKRADVDGFATDAVNAFYRDLARGGSGLLITGNALVHVSGCSAPQMLCIHNDHYIDKLRRLTDTVHRFETPIVIQISHGGRQSLPVLLGEDKPMAPSAVPDPATGVTPREMSNEDVWMLVDAFAEAARRAVLAGFDGIQIHAAHGYLASEFLSPHTNRRDDYWGGDEERRFHFMEEVYKTVRKEAGEGYPVMVKMNADDYIEGGLRPDEAVRVAARLQELGVDAIEVSGGMYESAPKTAQMRISKEAQEAYFRANARFFKERLNVPVMLVGGIRSKSVAEDVLLKEEADLLSLSRPLIREPDLPIKFMQGKDKSDCISCNGCMRFNKIDTVKCVQLEKEQR